MRKRLLPLLTALLLLLCACRSQHSAQPEDFLLYFAVSDEQHHGSAIDSQSSGISADTSPEALINALLSGPTQETLSSPFPKGLSLRSCQLEDGVLSVEFSEPYGGLSDVGLTVADYCVVLTVSQLDGIEFVEIRAAGYPGSARRYEALSLQEAMTDMKSA